MPWSVGKGCPSCGWAVGTSSLWLVCCPATEVLGCRQQGGLAQPGIVDSPHRPTLASAQLTGFFGALDSVLRYRATVLQAFKDMNRLTMNATVLSTRDVLVLLHKWSLIERDVRLQEDLRAATEKCQVRELLSECPLRGSVSSLTPQACLLPSPPPQSSWRLPPPSEQHVHSCQGLETGSVCLHSTQGRWGPSSRSSVLSCYNSGDDGHRETLTLPELQAGCVLWEPSSELCPPLRGCPTLCISVGTGKGGTAV